MDALVGYTGFVGSNILNAHQFDAIYNSSNIEYSYGSNPELLVYAGVTGTKFYANGNPEKDFRIIESAIDNIKRINPKRLVLISTVDVYDDFGKNESDYIGKSMFSYYGNHRRYLENWVINNVDDYHIIRLPALYGANLKKNFVYDLINIIPPMLNIERYEEMSRDFDLRLFYTMSNDGLYHFSSNNKEKNKTFRERLLNYHFNAISFTDSRSEYQYYNLGKLWKHINLVINNDIDVVNLVTPPIKSDELFKAVYNTDFDNKLSTKVIRYNVNTKHDNLFGQSNSYIMTLEEELNDIINYILEKKRSL